MPTYYQVQTNYGCTNGKVIRWSAGDIVQIDLAEVGHLVRDGAPIDFGAAMSEEQAAQALRDREAAAARDDQADAERAAALRAHRAKWAGENMCPGRPDGPMRPEFAPHPERLLLVEEDGSGGYVIACIDHLDDVRRARETG